MKRLHLRSACITASSSRLETSGGVKKLVIGRSSKMTDYATCSIHSEDNALNKLIRLNKYRRYLKRGEKIDALVVRISKSGVLGYSRPCRSCLRRLSKSAYPINQIYYSIDPANVTVEKFNTMFNSPLTLMSSGDRRNHDVQRNQLKRPLTQQRSKIKVKIRS